MDRRSFLQCTAALALASQSKSQGDELHCDVLVVGGGVGGFAAALAACRNGMQTILTEETDWLGGQLTAQAVPPDEHPWIEQFGCTRSYREYRNAVRDYYRRHFHLSEAARTRTDLNPGNGTVSRLTHEPKVSVAVLDEMLAGFQSSGQLLVLRQCVPESATVHADRVASVTLSDLRNASKRTITAQYFIDATELGDLLPLTNTESVTGAESQSQTGEMHAAASARPANSQSFTFCFAMDYLEGEDHTIERPAEYVFWRDYVPQLIPAWTGPLLSWTYCEPKSHAPRTAHLRPNPDEGKADPGLNLWLYRRIADRANFAAGSSPSDITLVNWPQNDCWLGDLVTAHAQKRKELLRASRQLSLSFLYWMQTDASLKGLRLRKDVVDTNDGLAKSVYIREARRIQAEFTILEQHVGTEMRSRALRKQPAEVTAETFPDSVGVGCYRIDLHPSAQGNNYIDVSSLPFQIPLGALLPKRIENLLPASKNIGTTHVTNGCYRLHPVEWNIGEAAGALAALAITKKTSPRAIRNSTLVLADFQRLLVQQGFGLSWPNIHPV